MSMIARRCIILFATALCIGLGVAEMISHMISGDMTPPRLVFVCMILGVLGCMLDDYVNIGRERMRDSFWFVATIAAIGLIFEVVR